MALTQDQSALLQTAVDNLNESVQVNKEVLEIVKSVGNTGAVDISVHDNDTGAHENGIDSFLANLYVYVKSRTFSTESNAQGNPWSIRLGSTSANNNVGNATITLSSRLEPTVTNYFPAVIFDNVMTDAFQSSNVSRNLGSFYSRVWDSESESYKYRGVLIFGFGHLKQDYYSSWACYPKDNSASTSLNLWPDSVLPSKTIDIGSSTFQFKDLYLQNSPIVSSDRRLKQNFESVPEAVFTAWGNVNFQVYKFKEAVAKKGEATARKHVGLVAQDIIEAFQAQGLDAFDYGIVCHDSWEDQYQQVEVSHTPAVLDEQGNVVTPENTVYENELVKPAGDVYTVRYEEALALEAAYQRWKLGKIEAALAAKGITL